jgi:hypothetical protein
MSLIEQARKNSDKNKSEHFTNLVNESIEIAIEKIKYKSECHHGIYENDSVYLGEADYAKGVFRMIKYKKTADEQVIKSVGDYFRQEGFTVSEDHRTISWK